MYYLSYSNSFNPSSRATLRLGIAQGASIWAFLGIESLITHSQSGLNQYHNGRYILIPIKGISPRVAQKKIS